MSESPRIAALQEYGRQAIERLRSEHDREDKKFKALGRIPIDAMRDLGAKAFAIKHAEQRLAHYRPELGREHCPDCYIFREGNISLDFTFHQGPGIDDDVASVGCSCPACGFTGNIPPA